MSPDTTTHLLGHPIERDDTQQMSNIMT